MTMLKLKNLKAEYVVFFKLEYDDTCFIRKWVNKNLLGNSYASTNGLIYEPNIKKVSFINDEIRQKYQKDVLNIISQKGR